MTAAPRPLPSDDPDDARQRRPMSFYGEFSSARMKFMPGVEDTVDLYLKMMLGMVVVFPIPTVVFFLAIRWRLPV